MIFIFIYQAFCIWWAYKNASWANPEENWKIKHWLNGLMHLTAAFLIGWFYDWKLGVSCLLYTRVIFDASMNVFRRLGLGYVSPFPASWLDKQEKKLVIWIAGKDASERKEEWTAIGIRLVILGLATMFLFI